MKAWYFATKEKKLRYNDDREIVVGITHSVEGQPVLCLHGLHASERLIDALRYAPGPILYEVELSGEMDVGTDKVCAQHRTYLRELDASDVLRAFARKQALLNIELVRPHCSDEQFQSIMTYLTGQDLSEEARAAAAYVAYAAVYYAANAAATAYVASAAAYAARAAYYATDAAYAAYYASYAANAANYAADADVNTKEEQNKMLTEMIEEAFASSK